MPVTKHQAEALAPLIAACRPHGAPRWHEAGIIAAIEKVRHMALPEVIRAFTRGADDRSLETPMPVANVMSRFWVEPSEQSNRPPLGHPPRRDEACVVHGGWADNCPGCAADALAVDQPPKPGRPTERLPRQRVTDLAQAARRRLHAN